MGCDMLCKVLWLPGVTKQTGTFAGILQGASGNTSQVAMDDPGPTSSFLRTFPQTRDGPVRPTSPPLEPLLTDVQEEESSDESLYTILNLARDATEAEIRDRYRSLATTFHPDRQRDDRSRLAAHGRFTSIQRAYEILTDSTKRTIYDLFGEEGLKTSWELGPRIRTKEEMRAEFQRQAGEKRRVDAEALIKPKGDINLVLDARAVFVPRTAFKDPDAISHTPWARLQRVRPGQIVMKHSFETPVGDTTQLQVTGQMASRNGAGGGNVVGTVRHQFSPKFWVEGGAGLLNPRVLTGKATYTVDENTFVTVNSISQTFLAPPTTSVTLGRRLYANTTGLITFKSGFWSIGSWGKYLPAQLARADRSALSVALTTTTRDGSGWTLETQAGVIANHISADWSTRVIGGLKVKVGAAVGTDTGINAFVDGEGKVTTNVRAGMMVQLAIGGGVTMRLKFSRLGQRVSVPILLSHNLNPYVVFGSTVLPAAAYIALYRLYLLPRKRRRIAERVKELREENAEFITQKKSEAEDAIRLMTRSAETKMTTERTKHGLIILQADYGVASAFTDRGIRHPEEDEPGGPMVIDVTIPLQSMTQDSKVTIPGGRSKADLLGFYDPCIGESKKLRIRYLFREKVHEVTVTDKEVLRIPMKGHSLD